MLFVSLYWLFTISAFTRVLDQHSLHFPYLSKWLKLCKFTILNVLHSTQHMKRGKLTNWISINWWRWIFSVTVLRTSIFFLFFLFCSKVSKGWFSSLLITLTIVHLYRPVNPLIVLFPYYPIRCTNYLIHYHLLIDVFLGAILNDFCKCFL